MTYSPEFHLPHLGSSGFYVVYALSTVLATDIEDLRGPGSKLLLLISSYQNNHSLLNHFIELISLGISVTLHPIVHSSPKETELPQV